MGSGSKARSYNALVVVTFDRLAAAPITWGVCELPNWGTVLPYERVLDEMAAAGFRGTELGPAGYLPEDPAGLRRALAARSLRLVGAFCPVRFHDAGRAAESMNEALQQARLLAALECPLLIAADAGSDERRAAAGRVSPEDALPSSAWTRLGEHLTKLAERCAPLGVRVAFHPHAGTYVETADEIDRLMAATPASSVGLCLDTGHLVYGGADPVAVCRRYLDRVWHVHAKDVKPGVLERVRHGDLAYETAVGEGVFAPLGEGAVDFPALVRVLEASGGRHGEKDRGYAGWYVLEQDVRLGAPWPEVDPAANARRSARYLASILAPVTGARG